jgi:outer membrane protein assembly factor BamB
MSYRYYYMQRNVFRLGAACAAAVLLTAFPAAQNREPAPSQSARQDADYHRYWPMWRGPHGIGTSTTANPPIEWSETRNVRWKVEIPGRGHSSPIVWGDRVYVTTAVPVGVTGDAQHAPRGSVPQRGVHQFVVMALDRKTGKTVWRHVAREQEPHERSHVDNGTWASPSPFTDGERLYAYFESFGLYAYDLNGKLLWEKDFGDKKMRQEFGEGSTPALFGNTIVVVWDHLGGESFVIAVDKRDGKELWRQPRKEIDTWATPLILNVNGRPQAIVPAMERVRSYDLATGEVVWESKGLTMNPIPSPVHDDGLVFLMAGFRGNDLKAVRVADAKGNIDGTNAIVWSFDRDTPYVPSPVLTDGVLYFLKSNSGILSAFDAKTGKPHYQNQRLEGAPNVFASPVAARGRIYFPGQDGGTVVIKSGPAFEVLATNTLDDGFDASPALVDNEMFLRGRKFLYAIAQ